MGDLDYRFGFKVGFGCGAIFGLFAGVAMVMSVGSYNPKPTDCEEKSYLEESSPKIEKREFQYRHFPMEGSSLMLPVVPMAPSPYKELDDLIREDPQRSLEILDGIIEYLEKGSEPYKITS